MNNKESNCKQFGSRHLASLLLAGITLLPGRTLAQAEPPHPILSISGSGSGASTILSSWTESQYTNNFIPRQSPRNDDYGFVPPVVPGDTGWSWNASAPNQITSTCLLYTSPSPRDS